MKYDLDLGKFRRARVWLGELPDALGLCDNVITRSFPILGETLETWHSEDPLIGAVEILIPTGPSSMYGLLGARFAPAGGVTVTAEVCTSSSNRKIFIDSLTSPWEPTYVGLPDEFTAGVFEGVDRSISKSRGFPAGVLRFDCSAHTLVGSSHMIFRWTSEILLDLFSLHSASPLEQSIVSCFPETFMR